MKMEHRTFTLLVMSATGGIFYSRLLGLISENREKKYCVAATWIRRKIIFVLMKSIGICIIAHQFYIEKNSNSLLKKLNFLVNLIRKFKLLCMTISLNIVR